MKPLLILIFSLCAVAVYAQDDRNSETLDIQVRAPLSKAQAKVSKSMSESKPDGEVAAAYEGLAKEWSVKGDHAKAEEYLIKARGLYVKLKNKDKIAAVDREIAKAQEAQNKVNMAIKSYISAGANSNTTTYKRVNANDAKRLQVNSDTKAQSYYLQQNIGELKSENSVGDFYNDKSNDVSGAYRQLAQVKMEENKPEEAVVSLNAALLETQSPVEVRKLNQELANAYVADKKYDKAIEINKQLVEKAKATDSKMAVEQLQNLSNTLFDNNNRREGLESLKESYTLAVEKGHTMEAKKSLEMLVSHYNSNNKARQALDAYADFMTKLEPLIGADSSLVDAKAYQVHEERISQLEKERKLKDMLIERKNIFNYVLLGSIALILLFMLLIARTLRSIKRKNKQIALQSLRREMNPHFIFNSLNSVNQFIAQNNELEANKYLSSYSKLMRNIMENSNKDFIPLSIELEQLREYLDLEYMRFSDKFSYTIHIDEAIDTDAVLVPNMLIQPQLENAIWHGLRYKDTKGLLILSIAPQASQLRVTVDDDGIGMKRSLELKTKHQRSHNSRGMNNTAERIELLNDLYNSHITLDIDEKQNDETGVVVTFRFPMVTKSNPKSSRK